MENKYYKRIHISYLIKLVKWKKNNKHKIQDNGYLQGSIECELGEKYR